MNNNRISIGNCGEYFVAGELERRGYTVGVPMSNSPAFDILAIDRKNNEQYAIQVKTTSYGNNQWMLDIKNQDLCKKNVYYVLVHLHELGIPEYFVIPSCEMSRVLKQRYSGKTLKSDNRSLTIKENDELYVYRNNWDIIGL